MVQIMGFFTECALGFFFDKGADGVVDRITDTTQSKKLIKEIEEFSLKYYNDRFDQIPMSQEFDFFAMNEFLHRNLHTSVAACFNAPERKQRLFFREQILRQSYDFATADTKLK